jgi:hypothetical protein
MENKCFKCKTGKLVSLIPLGIDACCCEFCETIFSGLELFMCRTIEDTGAEIPSLDWGGHLNDETREEILNYVRNREEI